MTASALARERSRDVETLTDTAGGFSFAPPEPFWSPLVGRRPRAAGRLLAFVAATGLALGLLLWIAGSLVATAIRAAL